MNVAQAARALGGDVVGHDSVLCPGPGHSPRDRSLSVRFLPDGGFICFSHSPRDDWRDCREHVASRLGLPSRRSAVGSARAACEIKARAAATEYHDAGPRLGRALDLWHEARDPRRTVVESYLQSRKLSLPNELAGRAMRFHPRLWHRENEKHFPGMIALFRDVHTDEPCAIHRTWFDRDGKKFARKMYGRAKRAAIKLDADDSVAIGLVVGEGIETCIAARLAGLRPVWAMGTAVGIEGLPVLEGVDGLTLLAEHDDGGANARAVDKCGGRWHAAGREVIIADPPDGCDFNDVWMEVA